MRQRWSLTGGFRAHAATALADYGYFAQAVAAEFACSQLAVAVGASTSWVEPGRHAEDEPETDCFCLEALIQLRPFLKKVRNERCPFPLQDIWLRKHCVVI